MKQDTTGSKQQKAGKKGIGLMKIFFMFSKIKSRRKDCKGHAACTMHVKSMQNVSRKPQKDGRLDGK
jgi:hypothetical protein